MYPRLKKIRGLLQFDETIDMSDYISSDSVGEACNLPAKYELLAVAVHMGSIHGGHYVAYAKKEDG